MATSPQSWAPFPSLGPRPYVDARTSVDANLLFKTLAIRGIAVGAMGALVYFVGRSMISDLMEEVRGGLV